MCFPTRHSSIVITHHGHRVAANRRWQVPFACLHLRLLVAASRVQRVISLLS